MTFPSTLKGLRMPKRCRKTEGIYVVAGVWISHPVLRAVFGGSAEREAEDPAGRAHHRGEEDDPQPARKHQ